MALRIKYTQLNGAPLKISNPFRYKGKKIYVVLHLEEMYFEIIEEKTGMAIAKGGNVTNEVVLMRKAKRELVKLGIKFEKETRIKETK